MESRERLLRFFKGSDIDRLPIWLLFPYHRLGCYADVYNEISYTPIIERITAGDCDTFDRRGVDRNALYTASPEVFIGSVPSNSPQRRNIRELRYKNLLLQSYIETTDKGTKAKFMVDDPLQLKKLLDVPYVPTTPDLSVYRKEKNELGNKGLYMMDLGDPLGSLYNLMSAEDFSLSTATDYDILLEFLDTIQNRTLDLYRYFLENDIADCYFIVGCEFAGPPLVSPQKFGDMSERYVKSICDLIREYGKTSIVHYHGNLYRVLSNFKRIGMDGLHTIEAPPIGDCSLTQAREALGKEVALIGNVQYDDLARQTSDNITSQVQEAIIQAGEGKLILSPSAGPYETTLDDKTIQSYLTFIDAALKYGKR